MPIRLLLLFFWTAGALLIPAEIRLGLNQTPRDWRDEKRLVDMHLHINYTPEHLARAVRILDEAGVGVGVNLSGGTVIPKQNGISDFQRNKELADDSFPGRFVHYMNLDYSGWDEPGFPEKAAKQIEEGHRLGAAGLKEYKRLGLYLRDRNKQLIRVDDPRLDSVWQKCGELGMPVSIHVADPKAFWEPYNENNERWTELKDHKNWWFGDPNLYPPRMELLAALEKVIERHPKTKFVCVHFANNAEDLEWVSRSLDKNPNMMADLAARVPEIGRHPPEKVRDLFLRHQDRIVFGTDFQVYNRLILGSGGSGPGPTDDHARIFFEKHWRWLETHDRDFDHMTPIQGDWTISGIGLPDSVLRKVYFDNAKQLLARAMPAPVCRAARIQEDLASENLGDAHWNLATVTRMESESRSARARPEISTAIRALYSDQYLYLRFDNSYSDLTVFEPVSERERVGLWERDVVEAFIGTDPAVRDVYYEFEVAPTNEKLDLLISPAITGVEQRLKWNSDWETSVKKDPEKKVWTAIMKIPIRAFASGLPKPGDRWRANFYRVDRANRGFLAWNPTLTGTYHAPERFGWLEFGR